MVLGYLTVHVYYNKGPSLIFLSKDSKKALKSLNRNYKIFLGKDAYKNIIIILTRI